MVEEKKLKNVVEAVLKDSFNDVEIESVSVEPGFDEDGDKILRVKVIFNDSGKQLDPHRTIGVLRVLRPRFAEIGEDAFPVMSFIAKSDMRKPKSEAA